MPISTISSREFNQDSSGAKRAANDGPVFITDRGKPAHVLMSIKEYEKLRGKPKSIVEMLRQLGGPEYDFEFDPPKLGGELFRPVDFE